MAEVYVSTDVEADGPIPGPYSMISFASAAYLADKTLLATFTVNLELLPGTSGHPCTMKWWESRSEAWEKCRVDPQPPETALREYVKWVDSLPGTPVFVAYPVAYDFMFVYWYLMQYVGKSPFKHHGIDIRTYAMAIMKKGYKACSTENLPEQWRDGLLCTHVALDDAIQQGALFCNMLSENLNRHT